MGTCLKITFVLTTFLVFIGGAMLAAASAWLLISPDTLIEHIIKLSQNNGQVRNLILFTNKSLFLARFDFHEKGC